MFGRLNNVTIFLQYSTVFPPREAMWAKLVSIFCTIILTKKTGFINVLFKF